VSSSVTCLKNLDRDNHSSLFTLMVRGEEKGLVTLTPGVNLIKLFSFITDDEA
jgi:hypothetical protein